MQVSPHEFMQQVMAASSKRFTIEKKSDPVEFLSWLLNTIHSDLTGGKRKRPSIISKCFQVLAAQIRLQRLPLLICSGTCHGATRPQACPCPTGMSDQCCAEAA